MCCRWCNLPSIPHQGGSPTRQHSGASHVPRSSFHVSTCLAKNTQLEAYADDTTSYTLLRNDLPTAAALLQDTVNRLSDWGKKLRVAFESSKSQAITVTLQRAQLASRGATRTRNDLRSAIGHSYRLRTPLPRQAPDAILRSFPYCAIQLWNSLPPAFLDSAPTRKNLQRFKCNVNE